MASAAIFHFYIYFTALSSKATTKIKTYDAQPVTSQAFATLPWLRNVSTDGASISISEILNTFSTDRKLRIRMLTFKKKHAITIDVAIWKCSFCITFSWISRKIKLQQKVFMPEHTQDLFWTYLAVKHYTYTL